MNIELQIKIENTIIEIEKKLIGKTVIFKDGTKGTVLGLEKRLATDNDKKDFLVNVLNGEQTPRFYLFFALKAGSFTFEEEVGLDNIQEQLEQLTKDIKTAIAQEAQRKAEEQAELKRQAEIEERRKKAEAKYEANMKKTLQKLKVAVSKDFKHDCTFYTNLGWLAVNTTSISADIPDFADNWFDSIFGKDAPRRVIDSKKLTSGGYAMKWNCSFKLKVKNKENAPGLVASEVNDKGIISNTEFIFHLVKDCGFKFGKEQDFDAIMNEVPEADIDAFKAGIMTY